MYGKEENSSYSSACTEDYGAGVKLRKFTDRLLPVGGNEAAGAPTENHNYSVYQGSYKIY